MNPDAHRAEVPTKAMTVRKLPPGVAKAVKDEARNTDRRSARREEAPRWADEASPEARIGFYQAAARFERLAPWAVAGMSAM